MQGLVHQARLLLKHHAGLFDPSALKRVVVPQKARDPSSEEAAVAIMQDAIRFVALEDFSGAATLLNTAVKLAPDFTLAEKMLSSMVGVLFHNEPPAWANSTWRPQCELPPDLRWLQ